MSLPYKEVFANKRVQSLNMVYIVKIFALHSGIPYRRLA